MKTKICHICGNTIKSLGYARHMSAHRDRREKIEELSLKNSSGGLTFSEVIKLEQLRKIERL